MERKPHIQFGRMCIKVEFSLDILTESKQVIVSVVGCTVGHLYMYADDLALITSSPSELKEC